MNLFQSIVNLFQSIVLSFPWIMNSFHSITTLNPDITRRVAAALIHSTWQAAAGAIFLAALLRAMRNRSANARYLAACGTLLAICAATVWTFLASAPRSHTTVIQPSAVDTGVAMIHINSSGGEVIAPALPLSMINLAVIAWAIGVALLSLWQVGGWCWLQVVCRSGKIAGMETLLHDLMRRVGVRRAVKLIEAARIESPGVIGIWRPVVLIPVGFMAGLAPAQVEAILAHELAHIRRWDYLANLIQSLIETLLFYHPAVWWISAQIRQERENCCDDVAAEIAGDRVAYAEMLVMLEGRRVPLLSVAAGGGALSRRVRRLIGTPLPRRRKTRSAIAGILAAACVLAVVMTRVAPAQSQKIIGKVVSATTTAADSILPEDLVAEAHDYVIGPNDLLSVSIMDLAGPGKETVKNVRVGEKSGEISLPLLGPIKATGKTTSELERAIAKGYQDAALIQNAQVSVTVAETRSKTFSVLGLPRPGEYAITKGDFRLLDALVMAGAEPGQISQVTIVRKKAGETPRQIKVPMGPLLNGDDQYNVVIRVGDLILGEESEKKFLRVVAGGDGIHLAHDGFTEQRTIDWPTVEELISKMPAARQRMTVLEVGAASRDIPVGDFLDAQAQAAELVKRYHMAYVSDVGIQSQPATKAANGVGVYYIGGNVKRVGVYEISDRAPITLRQAIIAAGMAEPDGKFVQVVRRTASGGETTLHATVDANLTDPKLNMTIEAEDTIMVMDHPAGEGK